MNTNFQPTDPNERIESLDILRGFALIGILLSNILYFSGYDFTSFENLELLPNHEFSQFLHRLIDIFIIGKFYTLFSILFGVGFYLMFKKHDSPGFSKTYARRIIILMIFGIIHSLIWYGDILFLYALAGLFLILFRKVKTTGALIFALVTIFLFALMDIMMLPFHESLAGIMSSNIPKPDVPIYAYSTYPDLNPNEVMDVFKNGNLAELFGLNIHNLYWKWMSYIPSGRIAIVLGIFLLGYFLASINFFERRKIYPILLPICLVVGFISVLFLQFANGSATQFPSTPFNTFYKMMIIISQVSICLFYVCLVLKLASTPSCKSALNVFKPVGRMALTNYIMQTIICYIIFYNFGFNLIGELGLIHIILIAIAILIVQFIFSHIWLKHYRFGPLEWLWRSLTYKRKIDIRL